MIIPPFEPIAPPGSNSGPIGPVFWKDFASEAAALAKCEEFKGTRHMQRRAIPGMGVDCMQFVAAIQVSAGAFPAFHWPQYRQDTGLGSTHNHLAVLIEETFFVERIDPSEWVPQSGDMGLFKVGGFANHVGIFIAGRFWHVTDKAPVHHVDVVTIIRKLECVLRPTAPGIRKDPANLKTS